MKDKVISEDLAAKSPLITPSELITDYFPMKPLTATRRLRILSDPPTAKAWWESWRGTHYDLATGEIVVCGDPPDYAIAHEQAHRRQHRAQTPMFILWQRSARLPLIHRWAHLQLELEADRLACEWLTALDRLDALDILASALSRRAAWCAFLGIHPGR